MAKRMGLEDIIRDVVKNIGTGGANRPKKLLKRKRATPTVRRKNGGSYRDELADANRFGGKRPERKVVSTLMSYPPIKVYNDGSRERVKPEGVKPEPPRRTRPRPRPRAEFPQKMLEGQKRYPAYNVQPIHPRKRKKIQPKHIRKKG